MNPQRIFASSDHLQPSDGEPIRSVISESALAAVIAWHVKPGQRIGAHIHPHGQDTWTILSGQGSYQWAVDGSSRSIKAGDVVIAPEGAVHGAFNDGSEPLIFISVVCPITAGYEKL